MVKKIISKKKVIRKKILKPIDWSKKNPRFASKLLDHIYAEDTSGYIKEDDIPIEVIKYSRKALKSKYVNLGIVLYRGFGNNSSYSSRVINNPNLFIKRNVKKYNTSWTTSRQVAYNFTRTYDGSDGLIISAKTFIGDVYVSYLASKLLKERKEYEIILRKNPELLNIKIYNSREFKKKYKLKTRYY